MLTPLPADLGVPGLGWAIAIFITLSAAHLWLRQWVRRQAAAAHRGMPPATEASGVGGWIRLGLVQLLSPVALLIWIHGLALAAGVTLSEMTAPPEAAITAVKWAYRVTVVGGMFWLLLRLGRLVEAFLLSLAARATTSWDDVVLPLAGKAARWALPLLAIILGAPALSSSPALAEVVGNATSLALIAVVAFILFQVVDAATTVVLKPYRLDVADNLQARAIHTQVVVLRKVAVTVIAVFTVASMLMVFESVRQFGASILASAGIAGIVIGFAAQRSIATLLAGFQIALTQPIRVDDVVVVENEWGRIEDVTLTYVVVCLWDLRRLIVPIAYFIEQPFQNWTRSSAHIIGTTFLHVDYSVPIQSLREEFTRVLQRSRHWDGKVQALQVTDAREHTIEVRAIASAADASLAWDLRCEIREQLITFVQQHYPSGLPKLRVSIDATDGDLAPAPSHHHEE